MKKIIIVGAGPAGLMAAIAAASSGHKVTVFEQLPRPGAKLLSTGGTKCNLTNTLSISELSARFGRQGRFMLPSLNAFTPGNLCQFFADLGVPTESADGFHIFPKSNSAVDVLNALLNECERLGAKITTSTTVKKLIIDNSRINGIETIDDQHKADCVLIATGGKGYPALGGKGIGYKLAEQAGHTIVEPLPALTGIRTQEEWPGQCAGISFENCTTAIDLPKYRKKLYHGELLFTHHGLSGPSIIDLAGDISFLLKKHDTVPLTVKLFPDYDKQFWQKEFNNWQKINGKRSIRKLLSSSVPRKLADIFCDLANIHENTKAAEFSAWMRENLSAILSSTLLKAKATEGWKKAMVTRGGVSLKKVTPDTMGSRLIEGLFFAGEVLDLNGPCGGYNLQWAFSSGYLAGKNV